MQVFLDDTNLLGVPEVHRVSYGVCALFELCFDPEVLCPYFGHVPLQRMCFCGGGGYALPRWGGVQPSK